MDNNYLLCDKKVSLLFRSRTVDVGMHRCLKAYTSASVRTIYIYIYINCSNIFYKAYQNINWGEANLPSQESNMENYQQVEQLIRVEDNMESYQQVE